MASFSVINIILIILAVILVDVFCGDVTNTRQTNLRQNIQNYDALPNLKSTTTSSLIGQGKITPNPNLNRRIDRVSGTQSPKKWIQQNNIWIRNEQASSGGVISENNKGNVNSQGIRGTTTATSSAKPPLNRGDTYTVLKPQVHQTNRQQALINGLGGNQHNVLPVKNTNNKSNTISSTTSKPPLTPSKPMSYAGVVSPKNPVPTSTTGPKTPSISHPLNPQSGGPKKDNVPSTGPASDKVEDTDGGQDVDSTSTDTDVTDDELREFSENILRKDSNNAMKYVTLNLQGMTTSRSSNDEAPLPLLKIDQAAYKIPSIEKIILLYNNYFLDAGQNEVYTGQERIEENNLLDAVLATPVMQFARSFLIQKGKIGKDPKQFKDLLRQIWFNMYSRGQGRIGSSGFEHVFVAEIKSNQVSGLHNWLYFNEEESQKRANYLGYMKKLDLGEKEAILKYHFTFHDIDKPVGSMFIGTSPELELALYSTCFLLRADRVCPLKMNGNRFVIRTYTFRYRGKNMIGSAFPEI